MWQVMSYFSGYLQIMANETSKHAATYDISAMTSDIATEIRALATLATSKPVSLQVSIVRELEPLTSSTPGLRHS